jgi:hypothetical protein
MLPGATDLLKPAEPELGAVACDPSFSSFAAGPSLPYVDAPHRIEDSHAGHGLRTNHLREDLARAARRRQSFRAR